MADQEVIKHTKKVYRIWNSKNIPAWHKIKEFIVEIFIIVFAVSLSIWLHDKSEHNHQQKEVEEFLTGLKQDLRNDIQEMKEDRDSYQNQSNTFRYITSVKLNEALQKDSLQKYQQWIFSTRRLNQNNGRFEGFKSAGKIGNIENKKLQNDIMDLYQENIPSLLASTDVYIETKNQLFTFGYKNRKRITDSTTNLTTILLADEAQNLSASLANTDEIIERYTTCIEKMQHILTQIDAAYRH